MATKELRLSIERREKIGTTGSNALRAAGKIPAVIYGHGAAPESVAVDARLFEELLHRGGRNAIFTLEAGKTRQTALVRQVQRHPVTRRVIHADLQRVSADESITARLQIVALGTADGVRNSGAVMDFITHELEIEGPANQIPEHLEVDVTSLGVHEHVSAADIALPSGFKLVTPPETIVIAIEPSRTAKDLEEAAAGPVEQAAEPEVIGAQPTSPAAP